MKVPWLRFSALGSGIVVCSSLLLATSISRAQELYYASASMGAPNYFGGQSVYADQFLGVRFDVITPITVNAIGGHFFQATGGNGQIFGAIVQLTSTSDFPNSNDLSTPDVLGAVAFTPPPPTQSNDITIPFGPLTLAPGTYGLIYGTGSFGATGTGAMPDNNPLIGTPDGIGYQTGFGWFESGSPHLRLTVYVPEPAALLLIASAAALLLPWRQRRRAPA